MLCEQAEKLIPLFAGDDLPAREAEALNKHLESCASCRRLASEFEESRDWLRGFTSPQFDETMLGGLRDSVLSEISRIEKRRRWLDWIMPDWNPRFAFAASLALLLLIAAFGLLPLRRQPPQAPKRDQAGMKKDAGNEIGSQPGEAQDEHRYGTGSGSDLTPREMSAPRGPGRYRSLYRTGADSRVSTLGGPGRYRSLYRTSADSKSSQPEAQTVEPDVAAQNIELPDPIKADLVANREMTRIEFQTADPNIRIIWLAPKDSSLTKPNTNIR